MSITTEAIRLIDKISQDGMNRETATELIDFVEKQRGGLVTKQDLRAEMQDLRTEMQNLRTEIEPLKQKQEWLKWIMSIGFTALLALTLYLHGNTNEGLDRIEQRNIERHKEVKELLQKMSNSR